MIHSEAISLGDYTGGFSVFSKGKNFVLESGRVVKLLGKRSDFTDYLQELDETKNGLYEWKGPPLKNLFAGRIYKESQLRNYDRDIVLDAGTTKTFLEDGSEVVAIRGSRKN